MNWYVVLFTLAMASLAVGVSLPVALGLAWLLARKRWPGKIFVETLVTVPLVLPPVATGFALLMLFGKYGWFGSILGQWFGLEVVFTWKAVVLAMAVMSFPLVVRACRLGFEAVDPHLEDAARSFGAGPWKVFWQITLPLSRRSVLAGSVLGFARALGEFGATIVFAGNIAGRTTTIPLAIYGGIISGDNTTVFQFIIVSLLLAFGAVALGERLVKPLPGSRAY